MKIGKLPKHLVLFYLWRAAHPEAAVENNDPRRIECGADAQWYWEQRGGSARHFVWIDGRPLFVTFRGQQVSTREYNNYNGKDVAEKAVDLLRRALAWFEEELGTPDAAIEHLTQTAPANLNIDVSREYPPGRELFDAICPGTPAKDC